MDHRPPVRGERGHELLLEHCDVFTRCDQRRTPAVERLEQTLGNDLTRFLVDALAPRRAARVFI
jgi:hypothetical protein